MPKAQSRIKIVQRKAKPYVIHEFNEKGQHRLILVQEDGNKISQWVERHATGQFEGLFFGGSANYPLMMGVFRQTMVEHRTVSRESGYGGAAQAQCEARPKDNLIRRR